MTLIEDKATAFEFIRNASAEIKTIIAVAEESIKMNYVHPNRNIDYDNNFYSMS